MASSSVREVCQRVAVAKAFSMVLPADFSGNGGGVTEVTTKK
jgi:hypothetical protein